MGKAVAWIGGIFAPVGLLFAAIGGWLYLEDRSLAETGMRAPGMVVGLVESRDSDGSTYRPEVEFFDSSGTRHVFTSRVGSSPPSHSAGERVEVIYAPGAPEDAIIDSFMDRFFLPLMFGGIGTIFAAVGLGLLYAWLRRRRIDAQLRASGLPIQARFVECYRDESVKVNGRSPYRVVCQATHPATGTLHSFRSNPIWVDVSGQLAGRDVRVFVDPARPKRHFVDLTGLVDDSQLA